MPFSFNGLQYAVGTPETVEGMRTLKAMQPFDDAVIAFLNDLSGELRKVREYPDAATFGFWCRKAALLQEKAKYDDIDERFGKGIVFHSTPSNVPVNFAFSFAAGLLAGNANIVRLPGKPFEQVDIISTAVRKLLEGQHAALAPYIVFVKYPPVKEISDAFSAICSVRVIWGGDRTVAELRQSPIQARTTEITFADRHSIAVIDADAYLAAERKETIIQNFYNDTYYTDQNACTSPRIIFWTGKRKAEAKEDFWRRVHETAKQKYTLAPVQSVGKLNALYSAAAARNVKAEKAEDMLVTRLVPETADGDLMNYKYNSGFFFEKEIDSLAEIAGVCDLRCQTLTYYGVKEEDFRTFLEETRPAGIDRIVPMGKSMDFSLVWDGYDLIRQMSRRITVL
jgi:acyl-CoA reductase-like NAD-dependent aldehyde dehydrogenase